MTLNEKVAKARGWVKEKKKKSHNNHIIFWVDKEGKYTASISEYKPDEDITRAFELVKEMGSAFHCLERGPKGHWFVDWHGGKETTKACKTPEEAICRAYVEWKTK